MISTLAPTRYELALYDGKKVIHIFGYTARKSKRGIYTIIARVDLKSLFTKKDFDEMKGEKISYSTINGLELSNRFRIAFTGLTERQVVNAS